MKTVMLRTGVELGMTLIDTAEIYGDGAAEIIIGEASAGCATSCSWSTTSIRRMARADVSAVPRGQSEAVRARCSLLVSISAPTDLAVRRAKASGLALAVLARNDSVLWVSRPGSEGDALLNC